MDDGIGRYEHRYSRYNGGGGQNSIIRVGASEEVFRGISSKREKISISRTISWSSFSACQYMILVESTVFPGQ